ncbi:hypothetical protein BC937DRAFT_94762, partial [Endogone sp. FLAS-F59071]
KLAGENIIAFRAGKETSALNTYKRLKDKTERQPESESKSKTDELKYKVERDTETNKSKHETEKETETVTELRPTIDTGLEFKTKTGSMRYALCEEERSYVLALHTPGIKERKQVKMFVADDNRTVYVVAQASKDSEGKKNNLPRRFVFQATLSKKLLLDNPLPITVQDGVTTLTMEFQDISGKRKFDGIHCAI